MITGYEYDKEDVYWDVVSELRCAASRAGRRNEDKYGVGDCSCDNEDEDDGCLSLFVYGCICVFIKLYKCLSMYISFCRSLFVHL